MSSCTLPQYFTRAMLIGELAVRLSVPVLESKFTLLSRVHIFSISYKYMLSDNNIIPFMDGLNSSSINLLFSKNKIKYVRKREEKEEAARECLTLNGSREASIL